METSIQILAKNLIEYLKNEANYKRTGIKEYRRRYRELESYMIKRKISEYTPTIGQKYLLHLFGNKSFEDLSGFEKTTTRSIKYLNQFQRNKMIELPKCKKRLITIKSPIFKDLLSQFLFYKKEIHLVKSTQMYESNTLIFLNYLESKGQSKITSLEMKYVYSFINEMKMSKGRITVLKNFLKFLYEKNFIKSDFASKIPSYRVPQQTRLPSFYSKKEIEIFFKTVEKNTALDLRNYAMILMAFRLGMRASDIVNIKFENIDWENNKIWFYQLKNGNYQEHPLLGDIGNSIIDYIENGRPKTDNANVFVSHKVPHPSLSSQTLTGIVQEIFKKSGIDISKRRFGPHSMRHSLAYHMLNKNVGLSQISSILGHSNSQSTMNYLRIDITSMRICVLDVPELDEKYFTEHNSFFL